MVAAPRTAWELSEELIREVEAADVIVIGTPMNNVTALSCTSATCHGTPLASCTIRADPSASASSKGRAQTIRSAAAWYP